MSGLGTRREGGIGWGGWEGRQQLPAGTSTTHSVPRARTDAVRVEVSKDGAQDAASLCVLKEECPSPLQTPVASTRRPTWH